MPIGNPRRLHGGKGAPQVLKYYHILVLAPYLLALEHDATLARSP